MLFYWFWPPFGQFWWFSEVLEKSKNPRCMAFGNHEAIPNKYTGFLLGASNQLF